MAKNTAAVEAPTSNLTNSLPQAEAPEGATTEAPKVEPTAKPKGAFSFAIVKDWTPPASARKGGGGLTKYNWAEFSEVGMAAPIEGVSPNVIRKSINKFLDKQEAAAQDVAKAANGGVIPEGFKDPNAWQFEVYSMGKDEAGKVKGVTVLRSA